LAEEERVIDAAGGVGDSLPMVIPTPSSPATLSVDHGLEEVRAFVAEQISASPLQKLPFDFNRFVGGGKMLRGRIAFMLGDALGLPREHQVRRAAAVELCHAASLLHDDVIDGGHLRRHLPAFWVRHGASGAILAGDLLWTLSLGAVNDTQPGAPRALLVEMIRHMCAAEIEQELLLRGHPGSLAAAERIARGKTGALFAFIAAAAAPERGPVFDILLEAGYLAGVAYQLSDDILDITDAPDAGKQLGRDRAMGKITAASADDGGLDAVRARLAELRETSLRLGAETPAAEAWTAYWERDLSPAMERHLVQALSQPVT
jgi:geranylgeranyl pyrophosphate synthase